MQLHWQISVSESGTLCFAWEGDIYCSLLESGEYQPPERLGAPVNTAAAEGHPFLAPDESYLIFSSNGRPGGQGDYDLYVVMEGPEGSWSEPINLGAGVNTRYQELYPVTTPDEAYLFFLSNRDGTHSVYWVDFEAVKRRIME